MKRTLFIGAVVVVLVLATTLVVLPMLLGPKTRFAAGFSETSFQALAPGETEQAVLAKLGEPLDRRQGRSPERWCYGNRPDRGAGQKRDWLWSHYTFQAEPGPPCIVFDADVAREIHRDPDSRLASIIGKGKAQILEEFGEPGYREPASAYTVLYYSAPAGGDDSYEHRAVVLDQDGRVTETVAYTLWD